MGTKISQLNIQTPAAGTEYVECIISPYTPGTNRRITTQDIADLAGGGGAVDSVNGQTGVVVIDVPTREFNRTASTELLFDKDEINMQTIVQSGPLSITVAESGNLAGRNSVIDTKIQFNGIDPITFVGIEFFSSISQGEILLPAGTYQVFFFRNMIGEVTVSVVKPSREVSALVPLAIPANFTAVPGADPETELDLSSDAVPNASSYETDFSTVSESGPWTNIPAATGLTFTHTGRTPGTTYYYRKRAIAGPGFTNSQYATAVGATQNAGDVTPPVISSSVANLAVDIDVNKVVVFTSNEPLMDSDGVTEITDANILDYLTAVNSLAVAQNIAATIDASKTIITITPNVVWDSEEDITLTLSGVADVNGNALASPFSITFTTNDYTLANSNYVEFSGAANTAITNIICIDNANFDIQWTSKDLNVTLGASLLAHKYVSDNRSLLINSIFPDLSFKFYSAGGAEPLSKTREIVWTDNPLSTAEQTVRIEYRGAIDTNDGLDRLSLYIDGVLQGSKTLIAPEPGVGWPFFIRPNTAPFRFGPARGRVKDLIIRSNNGAVTELHIPVMRTGIDISGNNRHGSWA